jgi:hypothetical protein
MLESPESTTHSIPLVELEAASGRSTGDGVTARIALDLERAVAETGNGLVDSSIQPISSLIIPEL